jgi:anaerobic glycerol-3-phosphate dehydrogenase
MNFDALIIGGGAAGMSCALVLGSALDKAYAYNKKIGLIAHQKSSHLQNALFNNVLGLEPGTLGKDLLEKGKQQLKDLYPEVSQIEKEKVKSILPASEGYIVETNKQQYQTKVAVIAVGYTNLMTIKGLDAFIEAHPRAAEEKNRIWLKNHDHKIKEGLYVAGTLAGWRSQFAIACGSGAQVATDILTMWNNGKHTKVHDKVIA